MLRQPIFPEVLPKTCKPFSFRRKQNTAIVDHDSPRFQLLCQTHIHETVFLEIFVSEYLRKLLLLDATTSLLYFLENVE